MSRDPKLLCGVITENGPCRRPKGHDFALNAQADRKLLDALAAQPEETPR